MLFGRKMEEEKKVKLGIGIGVESYVVGSGGGLFTAGQFLELQQQALIYKYLAAGIAVPFHLLAPIWDSLAASFTNAGSIYKQFPSCMPFNCVASSDRMDPEPGRCRRTDGKKWRCGRNVVPDHKYCEQHVHRGRLRSRKPVENSEVAPPTSANNPKNSETSIQISPSKSLQLTPQSSLNTSLSQGTSTASGGYHERDRNIRSVTTTSICYIPPASETATSRAAVPSANVARPTTSNKVSSTQINLNIGVGDNISNRGAENCMIRGSSNTRNNLNIGYSASPRLGFSPKSVLQGSNGIHLGNQSGEELEPVRCRRTDGIKWPCKREGLLDEKYGSQHIRRGAKRQLNGVRLSQTISKSGKTDYAVPSTNLSISISAGSSLIQNDEKCDSITDSDTTITDTSLAAYDSGCESS